MSELRRRVLREALARAGRVLRRRFGRVRPAYKGRANIVTQADLESQEEVLGLIRRRLPRDDYMAEEDAARLTGAEFRWVVDPLDGTTNFAHGYPVSCVSIGLLRRGRPVLGGVYDPFRDELFAAEAGRGTRLNGRRVRVSRAARLADALLITGFPYDRAERAAFYLDFYRRFMTVSHDVRRSGSAALDLAWVAAGRADGFWEYGLSPWDVAAGWLLVREAGGKVTDLAGRPWKDPAAYGSRTLASNGRIHDQMVKILSRGAGEERVVRR